MQVGRSYIDEARVTDREGWCELLRCMARYIATSAGLRTAVLRSQGPNPNPLGQLSLASLRGRLIEYQLRLG